ncbi:MAG: hypothetical protein AVDCRST_MAG32-2601, partial [uncultured Nocardioides sp.]
ARRRDPRGPRPDLHGPPPRVRPRAGRRRHRDQRESRRRDDPRPAHRTRRGQVALRGVRLRQGAVGLPGHGGHGVRPHRRGMVRRRDLGHHSRGRGLDLGGRV